MNFYQAAVDNLVKSPPDGPTIGLILCRGKNKTVVEYTLRDAKSPIGVAEYRLLPPKLKAELPEASELKKLVANTGRFRVKTKDLKRTSAGKQLPSASSLLRLRIRPPRDVGEAFTSCPLLAFFS